MEPKFFGFGSLWAVAVGGRAGRMRAVAFYQLLVLICGALV